VVHAGYIQTHLLGIAAVETHSEGGTQTFELNVDNANVGSRSRTIRHDAPLDPWNQRLYSRLVDAEDGSAIEWDLVDKGQERGLDVFQVAVLIEVVRFDIGYNRNGGREQQERAVAFVCFENNEVTFTKTSVAPHGVQQSTNDDGRIVSRTIQHGRNHRSGCCLPVRSSHRDGVLQPLQFGQHLGSRDHGNLPALRFFDFRIVGANSGRSDNNVR